MSYVHDDQYASLLDGGVRDRAVLLGCRVDLPTMSMGAWTDWHAVVMDDPEEAVSVLREQDQAIERLTAENAALRKDAERLRGELANIANAKPHKWDEEVRDQFQQWAQNRARAAMEQSQ
jgi:hypothetical protein